MIRTHSSTRTLRTAGSLAFSFILFIAVFLTGTLLGPVILKGLGLPSTVMEISAPPIGIGTQPITREDLAPFIKQTAEARVNPDTKPAPSMDYEYTALDGATYGIKMLSVDTKVSKAGVFAYQVEIRCSKTGALCRTSSNQFKALMSNGRLADLAYFLVAERTDPHAPPAMADWQDSGSTTGLIFVNANHGETVVGFTANQ